MSGVAVIRYLLANNAPVLAVVPAVRIAAGDLPIETPLPAIIVKQISSVPRLTVAMTESKRMHTDRVQVSVLVKGPDGTPPGLGYPGMRALLALVLTACPNQHGTINGIDVDSVLPDIEGPDLPDPPTSLWTSSRDFFVKWHSP